MPGQPPSLTDAPALCLHALPTGGLPGWPAKFNFKSGSYEVNSEEAYAKLEDLKKMFRKTEEIKTDIAVEVAATVEPDDCIKNNNFVLIDVKGMFNREEAENLGFLYWRL